jgi:hypothetical protein
MMKNKVFFYIVWEKGKQRIRGEWYVEDAREVEEDRILKPEELVGVTITDTLRSCETIYFFGRKSER